MGDAGAAGADGGDGSPGPPSAPPLTERRPGRRVQLTGYLATWHGRVQSYGTRYVRPPVLAGDVSRPEPVTAAREVRTCLTGDRG
ncbi:hypothetical protein ACQKM2_38835 [Streptomyces sp. NPDC004126]|uniref:hypothetical protein n=1 Tax=Streptomyces sp. NPDC004126 TaxID=3390695 RepID=UPI003CFFADD5